MSKENYVNIGDKQSLGKYYFQKGLDFALSRDFGKAYEFFKECLDFTTCDCYMKNWNSKITISDEGIFNNIENSNSKNLEYFFVKAFLLCYSNDLKNPTMALDTINNYITKKNDEYGYYLKGKIFLKLNQNSEAVKMFQLAKNIKNSSRINYVIGRTKEHDLNQKGLRYMYYAFIMNPSCGCCLRELNFYYHKHKVILKDLNVSVKIWYLFADKSVHPITSSAAYSVKFREQISESGSINYYNVNAIHKFIECLRDNENAFIAEDADVGDSSNLISEILISDKIIDKVKKVSSKSADLSDPESDVMRSFYNGTSENFGY